MLRKIMKALEPSKDKWFDLNDLKLIAASGLALVAGWLITSALILIF